eukprot:420290-Pelagomonas_calceolata.AAC.1
MQLSAGGSTPCACSGTANASATSTAIAQLEQQNTQGGNIPPCVAGTTQHLKTSCFATSLLCSLHPTPVYPCQAMQGRSALAGTSMSLLGLCHAFYYPSW